MLLITCPHCGPRAESEFHNGGEAHIERPKDSAGLSDAEWAEFVFLRDNIKGVVLERWHHTQGCRRWFNAARNSVTYEILAIYPMGSPPPALDPRREI
jgi:heterotetrameric sarcosine oxidase delta subunit